MKRLARLEVNRAVLHLHCHVGPELPVEPRELDVGALGPIRIHILVVNKCAPHDVAFVRRERVGQHVCALGMSAPIRLWARAVPRSLP